MKTTRFQIVEIPVPAAGVGANGRLPIQDQPQLRTQSGQTVIIQALTAYDAVAVPYTPTGGANATVANYSEGFLVLNIYGYETLQYIPLGDLINQNSTDTAVQRFTNDRLFELNYQSRVDWTKSYILCTQAIAAGVSFLLGVHYYVDPNDTAQSAPLPVPYGAY